MKCKIPSYISDFVSVDMWSDTDNNTFYPNATEGGYLSSSSYFPPSLPVYDFKLLLLILVSILSRPSGL